MWWGFTFQIVDKRGNAIDLPFGNALGKGIGFVCEGAGNTHRQIYEKTRNQILHPMELIRDIIAS